MSKGAPLLDYPDVPLFDNGIGGATAIDGFLPSDVSSGFVTADDFSLAADSAISRVEWTGAYAHTAGELPTNDVFEIAIYSDNNGLPGSELFRFDIGHNFDRVDSGINLQGLNVFEFSADVSFVAPAQQKLWISIVGDAGDVDSDFQWGIGLDGPDLSPDSSAFMSIGDGASEWSSNIVPYDFRLFGTIPAPSSIVLVGFAAIGHPTRRRRA